MPPAAADIVQRSSIDVAVIGAGVFGSWIAYECQSRGKSVILADCRGPGNSLSSSGGESRILRVGYGPQERYSQWAKDSLQRWSDVLGTIRQETLISRSGVLWVGPHTDSYISSTAQVLKKLGVRTEILTSFELRQRFPQMQVCQEDEGILEIDSGFVLARRAVQALISDLTRRGAVFQRTLIPAPLTISSTRLEAMQTADGRVIRAKEFVFACGAWIPKLFPDVVGNLITPTRQEVFFFASSPGGAESGPPAGLTWVDFRADNMFYGTPDIENRGFKVASDRHGPRVDPDFEERLASRHGLDEVRSFLKERFPSHSNAPCIETRVCQYENSTSGDFLIDRHPNAENVWIVGGGSGHGFKHGPAVGHYVTSLLDGAAFEDRFSLKRARAEENRSVH